MSYAVQLAEMAEVELDQVTFWSPADARAIECSSGALGRLTVVDSLLADAFSPRSSFSNVCAIDQLVVRRSILSGLRHMTAALWDISDSLVPGILGDLPTARMEFLRSRVGALTLFHELDARDVVFEGETPRTSANQLPPQPRFLDLRGTARLERVEVRGGVGDAVHVSGSLNAKQLRIVGTRAAGKVPGTGVRVDNGASATLEDSVIENVQGYGVAVLGYGEAHVVRSAITDLTAPPSGALAYGAIATYGAALTFEGSRIERVIGIGVWAVGSTVGVAGLWIDEIARVPASTRAAISSRGSPMVCC